MANNNDSANLDELSQRLTRLEDFILKLTEPGAIKQQTFPLSDRSDRAHEDEVFHLRRAIVDHRRSSM